MTDDHAPSHEEIYEMAVEEKEDMMEKDASGAPEVVYLCEVSAEAFGLPSDVKDIKYVRADLSQVEAQPTWRGMESALLTSAVTIERAAAAMWREEAVESGAPALVAKNRAQDAFTEQHPELVAKWKKLAESALRAATPPSEGA